MSMQFLKSRQNACLRDILLLFLDIAQQNSSSKKRNSQILQFLQLMLMQAGVFLKAGCFPQADRRKFFWKLFFKSLADHH